MKVDKEDSHLQQRATDCGNGNSNNGGSVPVGITIAAFQRHQRDLMETPKISNSSRAKKKLPPLTTAWRTKQQDSHKESSTKGSSSHHHKSNKSKSSKRHRSKSFQVFLESSAIYMLCLVLPTLVSMGYHWYDVWIYQRESAAEQQTNNRNLIYANIDGTAAAQQEVAAVTLSSVWDEYVASNPTFQWWTTEVYAPATDYLCGGSGSSGTGNDNDDNSWTAWALQTSGICRLNPQYASASASSRSVLSDDVVVYSDFFTITVCAFVLAAIRMAIVQSTVPIQDSDSLEAIVRCKSIHLLSADYVMTPATTPVTRRPTVPVPAALKHAAQQMMIPNLDHNNGNNANNEIMDAMNNSDSEMFGFNIDPTTEHDDENENGPIMESTSAEIMNDEQEEEDYNNILDSMSGIDPHAADSEPIRRRRLYSAPRFATALFRLLYSATAAAMALYFFRNADFWPRFVLGHGSTAKCWDLSGGLTMGMDSDFDQRNAVLKQYFLWQASYHLHSGAFHILSVLVLMLHPKHAPGRFVSLQKGTAAYVRRLGQHVLAVGLLLLAYIFSSLRRLLAIGLFAFDVSSWSLHLLQVCINAPEESRLRRTDFVLRVYWYLVIPSFVVTRFLVWPAIWYSAAFESQTWLKQLENTLWPGSGTLLRNILHGLMIILQGYTVVYFRRLFDHPHLRWILQQDDPASDQKI